MNCNDHLWQFSWKTTLNSILTLWITTMMVVIWALLWLLCNLSWLAIDVVLCVRVEEVNGMKIVHLMLIQKNCKHFFICTRHNAYNESYVVPQDDRELNSLSIGTQLVVCCGWCIDVWLFWKWWRCHNIIFDGDAFDRKRNGKHNFIYF